MSSPGGSPSPQPRTPPRSPFDRLVLFSLSHLDFLWPWHPLLLLYDLLILLLILGTKQVECHLDEVEGGEPHLANDGLALPLLLLETQLPHPAQPHQLLAPSPPRSQRIQLLPASQPVSVRGVIQQVEEQEQGAGQLRGWVLSSVSVQRLIFLDYVFSFSNILVCRML